MVEWSGQGWEYAETINKKMVFIFGQYPCGLESIFYASIAISSMFGSCFYFKTFGWKDFNWPECILKGEVRDQTHTDPPVTPFSSHMPSGAYFLLYGSPCPNLYQMHLVAQVYACTHSAIPWVCVTSASAPGEKTSTVPAVLVLSYRCDALLWHWLSTAQIPVSEKLLDLFVYHVRSYYSRESWFHLHVASCQWVRLEKCKLTNFK